LLTEIVIAHLGEQLVVASIFIANLFFLSVVRRCYCCFVRFPHDFEHEIHHMSALETESVLEVIGLSFKVQLLVDFEHFYYDCHD